MYGTRGAPHIWQNMVKRVMSSVGFVMNPLHPCVFHHPEKDMLVVTHVDDFLCSGDRINLKWFAQSLAKEFVIKHDIIGDRAGELSEAQFLGRTIRRTCEGYEYEGNPKHTRILLEEWNLEESKSLSSPGCALEKPNGKGKLEEDELLSPYEAKRYRRAAARINYMSLDRCDLSFASKETSRGMANPTRGDVVRLKRILRYLKGTPRAYFVFCQDSICNFLL